MRNLIFTFLALIASIVLLNSFRGTKIMKRDGTEPGHTGSPGDSSKNCTVCHGGETSYVTDWVVTDIPAEGYTPGETYTIRAINFEHGATVFGFQISPQDSAGNLLGKIIRTDSVRTKFADSLQKYLTYTQYGVDGVDSLSWAFDWVAPDNPDDYVTFYAAFNSNVNGHKGSDNTYVTSPRFYKKGSTGFNETDKIIQKAMLFPNPASNKVRLQYTLVKETTVTIDVLDANGKVVMFIDKQKGKGEMKKDFTVSKLSPGLYTLRILGSQFSKAIKLQVVSE